MSVLSRILIVDDNPKNIQLAAASLRETGAELVFATDGNEALVSLGEVPVDLILMDVNMPGMDGFETVQRVKAVPEFADIPVIFLTAYDDQESIARGFEVGGVDYVAKPFHRHELLSRVKTHLELHHSREALSRESRLKENLLRELYHRVKNNLQVISGFLSLQAAHYDEPTLTALLHESNLRIRAMARVHEQLYLAEDPTRINIRNYLEDLIAENLMLHSGCTPKWSLEAEALDLPISRATLIGLIVNEILNNAFKHAFNSVAEPKIAFALWQDPVQKQIGLSVKDNGKGEKAGKTDTSLGMEIIEALISQLEGSMELRTDNGYEYLILFPEESLQ